MNPRTTDKHKYLAAFAITTLIFVFGLLLGNYSSGRKLSEVQELARDVQLDTLSAELQFQLISQEPCRLLNESVLSDELYSIGSRLDFMERELGNDNREVMSLKEYYHLLELRHWLLLNQAREKCSQKFDMMLYFYSNAGDCERCQEQGGVLTYLHRKRQISVYSFDNNIDNPALKTIKELYKVKGELPVMVINEQTFNGFKTSAEIEEALSAKKESPERKDSEPE